MTICASFGSIAERSANTEEPEKLLLPINGTSAVVSRQYLQAAIAPAAFTLFNVTNHFRRKFRYFLFKENKTMIEIISVRFKEGGKQYYFNPEGRQFLEGDGVIVETSRGTEYAHCVQGNTMIDEMELTAPLRPVVRAATEEDKLAVERNAEKERKAFEICQGKIAEHGLDMKLVSAEYSFEGNKVLFFFTSEGRVDFRALVKDLAGAIHARIELRQIGVRDEAKMLGGLGICGRPFCCAQFLDEFQPVSIKMAKTQNLSLNPTKISGTCGRLMCCLKYEQDAYEDLVKHAPKQESFVETPDGAGTVTSVNLLRQTVQVRLESSPETPKTYHNSELHVIRNGKGKRPEGYVEPPLEELARLRRQPEEDEVTLPMSEEASLSAMLDAYVRREEKPAAPETEPAPQAAQGDESAQSSGRSRSRNRRRRGKGGGEGKPAPTPAQEKAPAPEAAKQKPKARKPASQKPAPQKPAAPAPAPEKKAAPSPEQEKKATARRRRRRPRGAGGADKKPQSEG